MKKNDSIRLLFYNPTFRFLGSVSLCGLMFLCIFSWNHSITGIPKEDRVPASAVVTEIQKRSSGRTYHYDVFVRYTVEGLEFESRTDDYSSGTSVGDSIQLYYDRNHPFKIQVQGTTNSDYSFLFALLLFVTPILIGCGMAVRCIRTAKHGGG